jgi:hypothetical protein
MSTSAAKATRAKAPAEPPAQRAARPPAAPLPDHRPATVAQRQLQEDIRNSPRAQQGATPAPVQRQENRTGLPDQLKAGVENLSGHSLDDVKVHYNSAKPQQLQAHAYAQGTAIHLAPGQEQHLPHEAWHVAQQKQGRVKPTTQLKGGPNINDDAGLEKEADVMGAQAAQLMSNGESGLESKSGIAMYSTSPAPVAQRVIDDDAFERLDQSVVAARTATQTTQARPASYARLKKGDENYVARRAGTDFEVASEAAQDTWTAVTATDLKAQYTWPGERIVYQKGGLKTKAKGGDDIKESVSSTFTVSSFEADDLALVHHTTGENPHLTVENAHISAMHHLQTSKGIASFDRNAKKKPDHNRLMKEKGSAATDNLNFFPKPPPVRGRRRDDTTGVHDLSLATYLQVIRHAMDQIIDVPPVYGVEVVRSANAMAAAKGLNPAELFLPKGEGQERELFKAVMNMHKMGLLAVPDTIATAFAGYAKPIPELTDPDAGTPTVVKEGEGPWNTLQSKLVTAHMPGLITFLKTV